MKMEQVNSNCFAVLNEKYQACDSNSGLVNLSRGMVIDTQADLPHARNMMKMFARVWSAIPDRVVNTHEEADHVFGNQLFDGAEIIGHSSLPERMAQVAEAKEFEHLMYLATDPISGPQMQLVHPGVVAAVNQIGEDYNFSGVELVPPTTPFDDRLEIDLGPYADWLCPERIYMNVERAYREFRGEAFDEPWDQLEIFDEMYAVAMARSISPNF